MALMPKRVKFRKMMRGKMKGNAGRGNFVAFGEYGLQSLETSWITGRQIEAGRIAATHFLHREGKVHIRIFPAHSYTCKPLEVRGSELILGFASDVLVKKMDQPEQIDATRKAIAEVLNVLERYQGEWFTFLELEAMLPHRTPAAIKRGTYRLIDRDLVIRTKPPGGITTPIKVSYPNESFFD